MSAILPTDTADLRARLLAQPDLTDADRAALVQLFDQQRRYGLVWEDKPEAVEETLREFLPVLEEVPARALLAAAPNAPQHTLIEGDNLHALTVLSYTHAAQVDIIYIDPPYNTGNKDFIYNDRFVDREDGYRHSKWLSFIAKRLKLAKTLLKESGVIFISIDDNEQAQLKLLCDEVLGEDNFVANVIWEKNDSPKMDSNFFSARHDFILVYAKSNDKVKINQLAVDADGIAHYNKVDGSGRKYYLKPLRAMGGQGETRASRPTLYYGIDAPDGTTVFPKRKDGSDGAWRWSKEKLATESARIEWTNSKGGGWSPNYRIFADNNDTRPAETIWTHQEAGSNRQAKIEMDGVLGTTNAFNTPKPVKLLDRILKVAGSKSALILDFFAGSGTTLHATMALNAEDGGTRRCILVTNNENNICEQVTYERNRRVIQGYTTPKGVAVPGLSGNSLRYYRCVAPVPRTPTPRHKRELVRRATDLLCLKEDCYTPLPGVPAGSDFVAFGSSCAATVIVYDDSAVEEAVAFVAALPVPAAARVGRPWCAVYVFAAGSYPYEDEFADVADRVRLSALPEALYRAWQQLLPPEGAARPIAEAAPNAAPAVPAVPAGAAVPGETTPALPAPATPLEADLAVAAPKTDKRGNLHLF